MSESRAEAARERSGGEEAELIRGKRREADRRGEEPKKKMPATSQPFLSIPSLYRFEGLPGKGKTSKPFSAKAEDGARTLKTAQGKRASRHSEESP